MGYKTELDAVVVSIRTNGFFHKITIRVEKNKIANKKIRRQKGLYLIPFLIFARNRLMLTDE